MTRVCSGCGLHSCDGGCFDQCEADFAEEEATISTLTLEQLRAGALGLTKCLPDPLKHRRAAA